MSYEFVWKTQPTHITQHILIRPSPCSGQSYGSYHYGRSAGPKFARFLWGVPDYTASADVWPLNPEGEILVVVQIESMEGVRNIVLYICSYK